MTLLHPIRTRQQRAYDDGLKAGIELGEYATRRRAFNFLRAQADIHHGEPGDAIRRGALNHAADRFRDRRDPGRPPAAGTLEEADDAEGVRA